MDATLCHCCCRTMFPESHKLNIDSFKYSELWKSGRLRQQQKRIISSTTTRRRNTTMCAWWICIVLLVLGTYPTSTLASCSGLGRTVLTDLHGVITDGVDKYPEDEHCEWLIIAPSAEMKIQLTFKNFSTECTYDYLSIYDGDSFTSPKIATFSGDRTPEPVVASSGKMLIYLYSDTNYNLNGTYATYAIQNCTNDCSGHHGTCNEVTHTCSCNDQYKGDGCEKLTCPNLCGTDLQHGACNFMVMPKPKCDCNPGFVGESCSLPTKSNDAWGGTLLVASGVQAVTQFSLEARTGHGAVYHAKTDRLWVFGGYSLKEQLDDLVNFDFVENLWSLVTPVGIDRPSARHGHTMVLYDENDILVFGGVTTDDSLSNELWSFNIIGQIWVKLEPGIDSVPPGLADHSASIVNYSHLFVFGGRSETEDFSSVIYKYDLVLKSGWEMVAPLGGTEKSVAVRGHSSVYHADTQSFVVFGGFRPSSARLSQRSNDIHAFHVEKRYWTKWISSNAPRERAFHTANVIGNYMVIYGGNVHRHLTQGNINQPLEHEKCYEDTIELYHLGCHQWVDFDDLAKEFQDAKEDVYTVTRGRFGHATAVRDDSTLLVMGGYNGVVLKDTLAIKMPGTVAINSNSVNQSTSNCHYHTSEATCLTNPDCGWCNTGSCMGHEQQQNCNQGFTASVCHGTCSMLSTCESCALWGQGSSSSNTPAWSRTNELCGWCVQEQRCYPATAPEGYCADRTSYTGPLGWWGRNGTFITNFNMCVSEDTPPGMTWVKFRHPKNESYPDELSIVNTTSQQFTFDGSSLEHNLGGNYTAEYRGFVLPLDAEPKTIGGDLRVWMGTSKANSVLYLSTDDTPERVEVVASHINQDSKHTDVLAVRQSGDPVFLDPSGTYFVLQEEKRLIKNREALSQTSYMELKWDGNWQHSTQASHALTAEYLKPYSTATCSGYSTCMGCLMDTSCGWCPISDTCEKRNGPMLSVERCGTGAGNTEHYLVTDVANCGSCDVHVDCLSCAQDQYCEWVLDEPTCVRRGRFQDAVTDPGQCHGRCSQYTTCSSCSKQVQECAWCEGLQSCFMFGTYITTYTYGQCSHWFDMKKPCPDCSVHSTCSDCLAEFQCGWCGNSDNPTIGTCRSGDFGGPVSNSTCDALIASHHNMSLTEPSDWSYKNCPDVEECRLGLDECHANATCINTPDAYQCQCKRGFVGNGKTICNKTCYHDCEHGHCSGPPNYECICDIGWTGINCSTDCGCNYHSTCVTGIGVCDDCQHWTKGNYCELCLPGSYGNATNSPGCQECQCNGHGDAALGTCDNVTGKCYCTENTSGDYCDTCVEGFYGDPSNNEHCYHQCEGRMILTDIESSALGSDNGTGILDRERAYCLWILTVYNNLTSPVAVDPVPSISLTVNDIRTACGRDYVYVYDGIPADMVVDAPAFIPESKTLGAFCGHSLIESPTVVAHSGILTIVFQANISDHTITSGFTAVFNVNSCPNSCHGNRRCDESNRCLCKSGYRGDDCETKICPDDCGELENHGVCNETLGLCSCTINYLGPSCQYFYVDPLMQVIWTTLYDPSLQQTMSVVDSPSDLKASTPVARMGHSMVIAEMAGKLWVFGGYSQDIGPLNDIWMYDLIDRQWQQTTPISNIMPSPRHFHAAVFMEPNSLYIVGGLTANGVTNDFWEFNMATSNWTQIKSNKNFPHVAGHSLTLIDSKRLILIGGYSPQDGLLHAVVQYTVGTHVWEDINTTGTPPTGVYGHSTVWHMESQAMYVFGGYRFHLDSIRISDKLYSLNYATKQWSMLPPEPYNKPEPHMFHAAVGNAQYMLIIGGGTPSFNFSNTLLTYRFDCNKWVDLNLEEVVMGATPPPASSLAAAISGSTVYVYGGTNGRIQGQLSMLNLPDDLCTTKTTSEECRALPGCAACVVSNNTNQLVFCRSNAEVSLTSYCTGANTLMDGIICDAARLEARDCRQLTLCSDCVMTHPAHNHEQTCKWCSNCPEGKCIPKTGNCLEENDCQMETQREIISSEQCAELACEASDCEKCTTSTDCIWTKQFMRTSEARRMLNSKPVYDWNCFNHALLRVAPANYDIQRVPPNLCPVPCYEHTNCGDCLDSVGADGGWQECTWSADLRQCMSPTYMPQLCATGECGPMYNGTSADCPTPCYLNVQCAHCLKQPGCGWCGINNGNGTGVCMEGGLHAPLDGTCTASNVSLKYQSDVPAAIINRLGSLMMASKPGSKPNWFYIACPPENECINGHHDCMENEDCHDTLTSYECKCKLGYERQTGTGKCRPVCNPGCIHGDCVEPNMCDCMFGYVGPDCSVACKCNGHSECESVNTTDKCLECKDNTRGDNCKHCLPLFVGNATNGGSCTPCSVHCHGNTQICISEIDYNRSKEANYELVPNNVEQYFPVGPITEADTVCVNCGNYSSGRTCETCIDGYFKDEGVCKPCQCNGHWDTCNKDTGLSCLCMNNTVTPTCPSNSDTGKYSEPCWRHQCSTCKELYLGEPTEGRQCYRQMQVEQDNCFEPQTQNTCPLDAQLPQGRSSFFYVQPKYTNLDIRLTVDVTVGALDVFLTYDESVFRVFVNRSSGIHTIEYDPDLERDAVIYRERRATFDSADWVSGRRRRSTQQQNIVDPDAQEMNLGTTEEPVVLKIFENAAKGINTFVTIENGHFISVVRNLKNRLVVSLPHQFHQLKTKRFYIALLSHSTQTHNATQGIMYFRQDQPQIDLFVFFSVFLSCFFLFLAVLVVAWKIKVGFEARNDRRIRALEMEHRASRPFGKVMVYIEDDPQPVHGQNHKRQSRLTRLTRSGSSISEHTQTSSRPGSAPHKDPFHTGIIATEPTDDGIAAIGTLVVSLPGGSNAPVRACLGSALVTLKHAHRQQPQEAMYVRQPRYQGVKPMSASCRRSNNRRV